MSIRITEAGILDTLQDNGRYGYAASGINPGGVMDRIAAGVANYLVGNDEAEAVIEMHFPAPSLYFSEPMLIALTGADFIPAINNTVVPINTPLLVPAAAELKCNKLQHGARCYLAVNGGFRLHAWLGSYSTSLKAKCGGLDGRPLQKNDELQTKNSFEGVIPALVSLPWHADVSSFYNQDNVIRFVRGNEYGQLTDCSGTIIEGNTFSLSLQSDRMGYRMNGTPLKLQSASQVISSAVTRGTIQLLPNGQLIVLMADHQTTGGYPALGHVISADIATLAQLQPNTAIRFQPVSLEEAESLLLDQYHHLQQVKSSCRFRLEEWRKLCSP